jgi:hypothetical protein
MILLGPGVAFGSIIPGSGALSVEVPQYIGASTFTALTAGLVSGSISGSATSGTATTVLNVAALSAGTVTSPQVLSGANVPFGTTITSGSIAAGATGVVGISTAQTVTNQTILALNPIPQSTAQHTGFLNVYFSALGVRPGRTIDLYQSNQLVIHDVASQSSETIVKTSISGDLRILTLNGTWNQTDLNSTALDIEGSIDQILVNSASVTGAFTFINDMSSTSATRVNSALRVVGSTVALPPGSIIVNHQGLNLLSSGSSYSGGTFIIGQNSRAAAFSSVEFIAGGSPITAAPATFLHR